MRALGNGIIAVVCTAVVGVVVLTNSASPPPAAPFSYVITLDDLSRIAAENQHLALIGARVRIVPLESSCTPASRPRPGHPTPAHGRSPRVPWVGTVAAVQAPAGETTIVLASPHGLATPSFQVHGRGPACVPVIGTVPYW